jgi:outer membrane protein assembly factor BamB
MGQDPEHMDGVGRYWCLDLTKAVAGGAAAPDRDVSPDLVVRAEKTPDGRAKVETRPNPASAAAWSYGGPDTRRWAVRDYTFGRTMSTACVVDGLLYVPELPGYVHCLDARTGRHYWQYDTKTSTWGSCLAVDGRVLWANDGGDLYVWRHDRTPGVLDEGGGRRPPPT